MRFTPPQSIEISQIHQSPKKLTFFSNSGEIPASFGEVRVRVSGLPVLTAGLRRRAGGGAGPGNGGGRSGQGGAGATLARDDGV